MCLKTVKDCREELWKGVPSQIDFPVPHFLAWGNKFPKPWTTYTGHHFYSINIITESIGVVSLIEWDPSLHSFRRKIQVRSGSRTGVQVVSSRLLRLRLRLHSHSGLRVSYVSSPDLEPKRLQVLSKGSHSFLVVLKRPTYKSLSLRVHFRVSTFSTFSHSTSYSFNTKDHHV